MTLSLAIAAVIAFVAAVALPRRITFLTAGAVALLAAIARVHGAGAGLAGLVAAAGVAWAYADTPARPRAVFGLACAAVALLAAPTAPTLHLGPMLLAGASPVVAALALTAALRAPNVHRPLAVVLALLPFPVAAVAPAHAELAVTFDGAAGAWALRRGLAFSPSHWPAWADALWTAGPWLFLVVVLVAYARPARTKQVAVAVAGLLVAAAIAQVMGVLNPPHTLQAAGVGLTGDALPLRAHIGLDGGAGLTVALRWVAIVWLVSRPTGEAVSVRVVGLTAIVALAAVALTTLIAPAWFGAGWLGDPGVSTLLLVALLATALTVGQAGGRVSGILHAMLAGAALTLIGAGELGWRVVGVVLGR